MSIGALKSADKILLYRKDEKRCKRGNFFLQIFFCEIDAFALRYSEQLA
jgi:hypothetical protein